MSDVKSIKIFKPNVGSQALFVQCPYPESLYHGTRGPGKTYALALAFSQYLGKGGGSDYKGIIFRRKYKELYQIRADLLELFKDAYGKGLDYKSSTDEFKFPDGEILKLAHAQNERFYQDFHGHQYPFLCLDELTSWATDKFFQKIKSTNRCKKESIPKRIRLTTNSLGPGHLWVKEYFRLYEPRLSRPIKNEYGLLRNSYSGSLIENPYIARDKNYIRMLLSETNPNIKKSWLLGSWDILAGGALGDLWRSNIHILNKFTIPNYWSVYRCLDWGSAKPYCVLWIAVSNGDPYRNDIGKLIDTKKGDLFIISELYGMGSEANVGTKETPTQVKKKIIERENILKTTQGIKKFWSGVADSAIFSKDRGQGETCIADLFMPLHFRASLKGPNSRKNGLELFREYLGGSIPNKFGFREDPGIFFFNNCKNSIRTLPTIPRDENDPEDVDTDSEDHIYDSIRYFMTNINKGKSYIGEF